MRRYLTTLLATALLVGIGVLPTKAQDELTLDDCIEIALRTRETIIRTRGNERLASAGKLSSLGALLPRVSARYSYSEDNITDQARDTGSTDTGIGTVALEDTDSETKFLSVGADIALFN